MTQPKPKNELGKHGRPTSFNDRLVIAILEFAKTPGVTDKKIAEHFGIAESTLYLWKGKYPSFSEALKEAKDLADDLVESAMFRMAVGYSIPDLHFSAYEGCVTITPYVKNVGPNFQAAHAWLKNRRPEEWREVSHVDLNAKVQHELPSREEALRVLAEDYAVLPAVDVEKKE